MIPGEKCICKPGTWYNAFGETTTMVQCGMRLTVKGSKRVSGATFLSFEETPDDNYFMSSGFTPLRNLN